MRKVCFIIFFIFNSLIQTVFAGNIDSLYQCFLSRPHDIEWMNTSLQLIQSYSVCNPQRGLIIANTLFNEATQKRETEFAYAAKGYEVILYRNLENKKDAYKSFEEIKPHLTHIKNTNLAFDIWKSYIEILTIDCSYETALEEAYKMKQYSENARLSNGIIIANTCMGIIFLNTNNYQKAAKIFEETLLFEKLSIEEEIRILANLTIAYNKQYHKEKALKNIDRIETILAKYPKNNLLIRENKLFLALQKTIAHLELEDTKNADFYMRKAKDIFNTQICYANKNMYYETSMKYFILKKEFSKALAANDSILFLYRGSPREYHEAKAWKAHILFYMKEYDKAWDIYKELPANLDSTINIIFTKQTEQINRSYESKILQTQHAKFQSMIYILLIGGITISIIYLLFSSWKLNQIFNLLRRNRKEMQKLYQETENNNIAKARFLEDISYKIRTPLNTVMGFSEILTTTPDLINPKDIESISESIKENCSELQHLVNSILDLSRLESGMMKFHLSDYSLTQICQDAIDMAYLRQKEQVKIQFTNNLKENTDIISTDVTRLTQILSEILQSPQRNPNNNSSEKIEVLLSYSEDKKNSLFVEILNAPLANSTNYNHLQSIQQSTARLFFEHFKGTFIIKLGYIAFTYPLK